MFKKVKDFENYTIYDNGEIMGIKGNFLVPWMGRGGYLKVCLSNKGERKWVYVHRLVCMCFIENQLNKPEINHIDGNKLNNNTVNLEWVTRSENNIHAFKTGLKIGSRGEKNVCHKLTGSEVVAIRSLRGIFTQRKLQKMFNVSHSHISKIQRNVKWNYLPVAEVAYV